MLADGGFSGAAALIAFIASLVTITAATVTLLIGIHDYIKNREKDLKGLEKELKKVVARQKDLNDDYDDLKDEIKDIEEELDDKETEMNAAWQKMIAADTTLGEKADVVDSSQVAYDNAVSAYDTHITYCYESQNNYPCSTRDSLYSAKMSAERALQTAKTLHNDSVHANNRATKEYYKVAKEWNKIRSKLNNRKADKADYEENLATLLQRKIDLDAAIVKKKLLIKQATSDAKLVEEAVENAPDYIERFNAAWESGADMERWVEICPPPESVKKFVEEFSRLQSTYEND